MQLLNVKVDGTCNYHFPCKGKWTITPTEQRCSWKVKSRNSTPFMGPEGSLR